MCGIAGVVGWVDGARKVAPGDPAALAALQAMQDLLRQRGPDGGGMWIDPVSGNQAGFVFRRLAIVDLPGGSQPMGNEDGSVQVVFNGEIYNHRELRAELIALGHTFASDHSDTEVLVHGWEAWGIALPEKLLGMFAFGVWDSRARTLFLARDRMGQKPLFYAVLEDGIVFGSTLPAVLAWQEVKRRVPRENVALYLQLGYLPPPLTIYRDVSQVVPGGWVRVQRDVIDGGTYWKAPGPGTGKTRRETDETHIEMVRREIDRAVESQLMADVPIACFLSGGMDSSIVALTAQRAIQERGNGVLTTIGVGFKEAGYDESEYAASAAARIGSEHHQIMVSVGKDVEADLEALMRTGLGEPFGDSSILPTFLLSRAAREIAPVALSGDGGDELFAGYDRYRALPLLRRWGWVIRHLPERGSERFRRMVRAARGGDYAVGQYAGLTNLFSAEEVEALLGTAPQDVGCQNELEGAAFAMLDDRQKYLPGDVLRKVDTASMAVGLEVRSPLLDHVLIEQCAKLPLGELLRGGKGKWILREAYWDDFPAGIFERRKMGFGVPIGEWFRGELRAVLTEALTASDGFCGKFMDLGLVRKLLGEHLERRRDHTHRLFAIWMLCVWWRRAGAVVE
jgi:asparagine synthase (glutamine-hydrolysing)